MIASLPYTTSSTHFDGASLNRFSAAPQDPEIRLAQNGDVEAFNRLVLKYQDKIYRQAFWTLGDGVIAEDACQEVFLQAYRKLHTFNGGSFSAWLLRITTNYCLDQIRASRRRPCQSITMLDDNSEEIEPHWVVDSGDEPEKALEKRETLDAVVKAIQQLSPEFRLPIILIDIQELDYSEACAVLHIPLGTLKSRLARARLKLRESLINFRGCGCPL